MSDVQVQQNDRATWLHGSKAECSVHASAPGRVWRLVLLGAPGVGKGTQAEMLCRKLMACHLSTGDIFRAAKSGAACGGCEPTAAMKSALEYMRRGDLVPDQTVLDIVRERVGCLKCGGGFLLDGFPRTVAQAEALAGILAKENIAIDAVVDYRLPIDEIVSRLSGRRTCGSCKAVFHVTGRPPRKSGICDHCGGVLVQREDDRQEAVRVRMEAYERSTAPLTAFYKKLGVLVPVNADGSPEQVFERTLVALKA